ncbi:MAG TPA: hypothetical protein VIJ38_17990 [Acidobacteriaceae bacterium]
MYSFEREPRAATPRNPEPTRGILRQRAEFQAYRAERERIERRSALRGLILLAVVALVGNIARAGLDLVFVHGWWRP